MDCMWSRNNNMLLFFLRVAIIILKNSNASPYEENAAY